MIIGFDANEANVPNRVGVGWSVFYLLQEFKKLSSGKVQFRIFLSRPRVPDFPNPDSNFKYQIIAKHSLWSQIDLPITLYLAHRDLDVFLSPAHYSPRFCPCPTVVIIHDLSYFYYPQDFLKKDLFQLVKWTGYSVKKAKKVIAVSKTTKQDLVKNYQVEETKITVINNGFTKPKVKPVEPGFKLNKPYFLYLGTLQPRKNLENLILGFEQFVKDYENFSLYVVGQKGWLYENIYSLVQNRKLADKVMFTDYLTEPEKWFMLQNAQALVMPGFYEGFGLPVLEAFSVATPVICSNGGALREVAGEAALYFDPVEPSELASVMTKIVKQSDLVKTLTKKGDQQLKNYSWDKAARAIIKTLTETK